MKEVRDDARRRIDALERRNQELEADNESMTAQLRNYDGKKGKQTDLETRVRQLEGEKKSAENNLNTTENQLNKAQDSKLEAERRNESLRREIDLLTQDKSFLQRESVQMEDQVRRLEDKQDRTEQALLEAKKQADKYMERVLNSNDDIKTKFDQKFNNEVTDLKQRYAKDVELVKQNLIDVYETKTQHLTERRDELDIRNSKLEKQLADRSAAYEELLTEFRQMQRIGDEEVGHLRVGGRAKDEEIKRVSHLYEDNMVLVKEVKLENESLKSKIDVLKSEYYKLESISR
jgi:progesterone-induced-blocking factor 1